MPRLMRSMLVAFALSAVVASSAMAEDVYKWTDANGVTHYADAPPEGRKYEKLTVSRGASRRAEELNADGTSTDGTSEDAAAATPAANPAAENSANCVQSRANLEILRNNPVVRKDLDGDGVPENVTGEALAQEVERAQRLVDIFCK